MTGEDARVSGAEDAQADVRMLVQPAGGLVLSILDELGAEVGLRKPLVAVLELQHEEGAGHNHNPIRGSRQRHRQFFERTGTLTPG